MMFVEVGKRDKERKNEHLAWRLGKSIGRTAVM
jgi:hypothetical protein